MKISKIFGLFALIFTTTTPSLLNAQLVAKGADASMVSEAERSMSLGSKSSLSVNLPKVKSDVAEKVWKDFVKQYKGSYKRNKKTDEYFLDNATVGSIGGASTVDMYMKFAESGDVTSATLWIDLGGTYVNSKDFKDKYDEAEKLMMTYALSVTREQTKETLKVQEKEQKNVESDLQKLERKNKSLHEDIETWKKKIAQAEEDIKTNIKQQEETKVKVDAQKKVVDEVRKKLETLN
jgi:hypothetical protein